MITTYELLLMGFLLFAGGVLIGIAIKSESDGSLKIDTTDPLKDKYLLELEIPLDDISKRKTITLKIKNVDLRNS